jgi:TP901 family phage tail tape measure protein
MAVDAGTIYSEVRVELDKLRGDIRKVNTNFDKFAAKNAKQSGAVGKRWTQSFSAMKIAGVAAFAALTAAAVKAGKIFGSFEQELANVRSVAGGSDADFAKLEKAAQEAGETTRFTATQAAEALYSLASAGFSATESADALNGVLQLAGATGSDLAFTSQALTAIISQFGYEASQAGEISNVFAAAIGNSQANMEKLTNAFRQVGPVAAGLDISLEETTGALQALFDAGFQGEQAGTALRNALGALANQTDPTVRKLEELGVSFDDVNPEANSLTEIIGNLADAGLSTGEVISAFGRRAGPQLLTLIKTGKQGLEEYTAAVTGTNRAAEAYAIQNDTLLGDFDKLNSALESFAINLFRQVAPGVRVVVQAVTSAVGFFNSLFSETKNLDRITKTITKSTADYEQAMKDLNDASKNLTDTERERLETTARIARLEIIKSLEDANKAYEEANNLQDKYNEKLERQQFVIDTLEKIIASDTDAREDNIRITNEQREALVQQSLANLAMSESFTNLTVEGRAFNDVLEEFGPLMLDNNLSALKLEKALLSVKSAQAETSLEVEDAKQQYQDYVSTIAEAIVTLDLSVSELGISTRQLREDVQAQVQALQEQQEENKDVEQTNKDLNDSLEEQQKKVKETTRTWRDYFREIAGVAGADFTGREGAAAFLEKIARQSEAAQKASAALGIQFVGTARQAQVLQAEADAISEVLEDLFAIDPSEIDEAFSTTDTSVRLLVARYKELQPIIERINENLEDQGDTASVTSKQIQDQTQDYIEKLQELNATQEELMELSRERALERIDLAIQEGEITAEQAEIAREAVNEYYDEASKGAEESEESAESFHKQLENIVAETEKLINVLESGDIQDIFAEIGNQLQAIGKATENVFLQTAGLIVSTVSSIVDLFAGAEERAREYQNQLQDIRNEIERQALDNRKALLDQEYDLEVANIERIRDAKINSIRDTLTEEQELELVNLGVLEETRSQYWDRRRREAIESAGDITAAQKQNIVEILNAQEAADKALREAEKQYQEDLVEFRYDRAVFERQVAIQQAEINKQKALSELSWWDTFVLNRDDDVRELWNGLIDQIRSAPLPPVPSFQTGGIVLPSSSGTGAGTGQIVNVAENGAPELLLNGGASGQAFLQQFAQTIAAEIGGVNNAPVQIVIDGQVLAEVVTRRQNDGEVVVE